jgi:hypothetical protein
LHVFFLERIAALGLTLINLFWGTKYPSSLEGYEEDRGFEDEHQGQVDVDERLHDFDDVITFVESGM